MEGGGFEPPKAYADRFTVCSLWPLGNPSIWSWRWDSNPQPADYKSAALPIELRQPSRKSGIYILIFKIASVFLKIFNTARRARGLFMNRRHSLKTLLGHLAHLFSQLDKSLFGRRIFFKKNHWLSLIACQHSSRIKRYST